MRIFNSLRNRFAEKPNRNMVSEEKMSQMLSLIATKSSFTYESAFEMMPNPDVILKNNNETLEAYSKFKYDAHVYSCTQSRESGVLSLEWEINRGGKETAESKFVTEIFNKLSLRRIISEMLEAPLYGFKPMEIYWKEDNGRIIPEDVVGKPPYWFGFDTFNLLRFKHKNHPEGKPVPRMKFLVLQHKATYDNPYGEAIYAKCFYPVIFKKGGMKLWSIFTEKYGMPYLHGKLLQGSSQEDIDDFKIALAALRQDSVLVTEDDAEIDIKEASKSSSAEIYRALLHFCNAEISKAILSQTLTTEQGATGSYAMSQTHLQVRSDVVDSDKRLVEQHMNKLIEWIVEMNFANPQDYPKFIMYEEKDVDKTLAERDAHLVPVLTQSGQKLSKKYLQKSYNFEDDDLEEVKYQPPTQPLFKEFEHEKDAQKGIERVSEMGVLEFAGAVEKMLEPVLKMVEAGADFEDIQKKVIELFPKMDTKEIEELIARGLLVSSVGGVIAGQK